MTVYTYIYIYHPTFTLSTISTCYFIINVWHNIIVCVLYTAVTTSTAVCYEVL